MRGIAFVRRAVAAFLAFILLAQSSGSALAANAWGISVPSPTLAMQIASAMHSLQDTQIGALLSGNDARWSAMHAPPPVFHREAPPTIVPPPRFVRQEGILNHGAFRSGPQMLNHRLSATEIPQDPRAMSHGTTNARCASSLRMQPCAAATPASQIRTSSLPSPLFFPSTPASRIPMAVTLPSALASPHRLAPSSIHAMSTTPTVQPFQYEADTTTAPSTLFYTYGGETGAISRTMDTAPANAQAQQSVSYAAGLQSDSFGWVSPANVPNSTSWPAQTYTVTLNISAPNPNLTLAQIRIYRVDANGGPSTSGLAVIGDLTGLTQSLGSAGTLIFNIPGSAQTASATDRIAVKIRVVNNTTTTQSFSYWAGQNSGTGMNLVQPYAFQADTVAGPTTLFYTGSGGETGAVSQIMDSSGNAAASETLSYAGSVAGDSWGWISGSNSPNLTAWPAGNYTVTLNVTQANANLQITEVKIYRVDQNGGPSTSGLAVVGDLKGLSQSLSSSGTLTFDVAGAAQTASATDRIAAKFYVTNTSTTTQSFSYLAGAGSGSGVNLSSGPGLKSGTTGVNHWWTYEEGALPGHGKYMVNVGNGNLLLQADDVDIPERGIDLTFHRTYNSQSQHDSNNTDVSVPSNYGDGWTNTFDAHLAYDGANTMSVYDAQGTRYDYVADGNGKWNPPAGQYATLKWDGSCGYQWTQKDGTVYYFYSPDLNETANCTLSTVGLYPNDTAYGGRLYKIWARNINNYITFSYAWTNNDASSAANLSTITATHADGHTLTLGFGKQIANGPTVLKTITLPDNTTQLTYQYDANTGSMLQYVTRPGNNVGTVTESYGYNAGHQMSSAASPRYNASTADGDVTYFGYDSSNRVTSVSDWGLVNFAPADANPTFLQAPAPSGTPLQTWRTINLSGYGTGTTTMTDTDGHSNIWTIDTLSRVTQTQRYTGGVPTYLVTTNTWDSANHVIESVDQRGFVTDFAYDGNGNLTAVAYPPITVNGVTFRPTSLYAYDNVNGINYNNVVAYCDPVSNHPSRDWNPTTSPTPAPASCPSASSTAGATRYSFGYSTTEPYGYLTDAYTPAYGSGSTSDPGYHAHFAYDQTIEGGDYGLPTSIAGDAISQSIDSSTPTRTPIKSFTYDKYGNLSSYNSGTGTWTYHYDSLNRMTSGTDPDGYTGYKYYFTNGQVSKIETPYQHARGVGTTFLYDADGDETQRTVYHGGAYVASGLPALPSVPPPTKKYYDGADRLVEVQQPRDSSGSGEAYSNPWITRYIYDLSQNGTLSPLPTFGGQTIAAHGNLFKILELLPTSDVVAFSNTATSAANGQYKEMTGGSSDALDRLTTRYFFVVNSAHTADTLEQETYTYDSSNSIVPAGSNDTGLLSSDCDALQECTYYAYDNDSKLLQTHHSATSALDHTYTYDAAHNLTGVTLPTWGTQSYTYDMDGRVSQSIEPSGIDSAATLTYHYYADGKRSALDVTASALNQSSLFAYAYRTDGKLETQQINQPGNSLVGNTSLSLTYTAAGRLTKRSESGPGANATPTQYLYDATYGYMTEMDYPGGKETGIEYDPYGSNLGWNSSVLSSGWTYQYSVRDELLSSTQSGSPTNIMANGVAVNTSYKVSKLATASWSVPVDGRMGVALGSDATDTAGAENTESMTFDTLGRLTVTSSSSIPAPSCDTCKETDSDTQRTYDQDNHVTYTNLEQCLAVGGCAPTTYASATYDWGAAGHPIRITGTKGTTTGTETLHWDGAQLLFTTRAGVLDDIKVGDTADITPQDSTYKGLTFWDRDPSHQIVYCHNASGSAGNGAQGACEGPAQTMSVPSSMIWGQLGKSSSTSLLVGSGGVLGMPRSDGFTDGFNTIQGVRVFDSTLGGWTTPDPSPGDVDDPLSQKSYVWNNNNPVSNLDSSGLSPDDEPYVSPGVHWENGVQYVIGENGQPLHIVLPTPEINEKSAKNGEEWGEEIGGEAVGLLAGEIIDVPIVNIAAAFAGKKIGGYAFGIYGRAIGGVTHYVGFNVGPVPDWLKTTLNVVDYLDLTRSFTKSILKTIARVTAHGRPNIYKILPADGLQGAADKLLNALFGGSGDLTYCASCDAAGLDPNPGSGIQHVVPF